ncbi:hypothetical protein P872_16005 [Rhodonellum psychrophilum GCM71 = DSM 17998]|uniref:Uncharacterized protein n=1 Tax=Rhodonellum psychrophilum GCM71 = DSM 17998 TaxID=1123057 RepID=U5C374_9BACT|nr:hypothetical protein P872_16005 [Rhodonellum psychrophilum GCM71 = DSM 17998]
MHDDKVFFFGNDLCQSGKGNEKEEEQEVYFAHDFFVDNITYFVWEAL